MKKVTLIILTLLISLLMFGCKNKATETEDNLYATQDSPYGAKVYQNDFLGFKVLYPASWNDSATKEQDKFGISDDKRNAILFMGQKISVNKTLDQMGILQLKQDYELKNVTDSQAEKYMQKLRGENITWYTYAIGYKNNDVESIVSGTICKDKHITIVLVSNSESYNITKQIYTRVLQSFKCINGSKFNGTLSYG